MPDPYDELIRSVVGRDRVRRYDEDSALDLIAQHESGGRNIKQQIVPAGGGYNPSVGRVTGPSSASGPWQITNSTWRKRAPREIAQKYPTAMSAPVEVQRAVAGKIFRETGFQDWAPYNASLRKAIARGEQPRRSEKPADDEYSKLISEVLGSEQPSAPPIQPQFPRGTTRGRATGRPELVRPRRPMSGQVADSGLGAPPISLTDLKQADEARIQRRSELAAKRVGEMKAAQGRLEKQYSGAERANIAHQLRTESELQKQAEAEIDEQLNLEAKRPEIDALKQKFREFGGEAAERNVPLAWGGGPSVSSGRLIQSLQSALANTGVQAGNAITAATFGRRGQGLTEQMRLAQIALGELEAEDPDKGWIAAAERSIPGASFELAKMYSLSKIPVAGRATLPALGATAEADKGVGEALKGAAIGELYHRGFGAMSRLPKPAQFAVGTSVPAGVAIAEGADPKRALIENTAFGAMALAGGRRPPRLAEAVPASVTTREAAPPLRPSEIAKRVALRGEVTNAIPEISRLSSDVLGSGLPVETTQPSRTADAGVRVRPDARGGMEREAQPADIPRVELRRATNEPPTKVVPQPNQRIAPVSERAPEVNPEMPRVEERAVDLRAGEPVAAQRPVMEAVTPQRRVTRVTQTETQATPYIGRLKQGVVDGFADALRKAEHTDESLIGGERWRYEPSNKTVYWTSENPSAESKFAVEDWLARRKQQVAAHDRISNYDRPAVVRRMNETQTETQPNVETQLEGAKPRGAIETPVPETSEGTPPLAGQRTQPTAERPVESVKPQWQHRDFGLITEAENQSGVGRGRVRVTAEDGTEHVIQRPKGTGAGNQIAIPVRESQQPQSEAGESWRFNRAEWQRKAAEMSKSELQAAYEKYDKIPGASHTDVFRREIEKRKQRVAAAPEPPSVAPTREDFLRQVQAKDNKDYNQKVAALEGYLSLDKQRAEVSDKLGMYESDHPQYKLLDKRLDEIDRALNLEVDQATKRFGVSSDDFISLVNDFESDKGAIKLALRPKQPSPSVVGEGKAPRSFVDKAKELWGDHWHVSNRPLKKYEGTGSRRVKRSEYEKAQAEWSASPEGRAYQTYLDSRQGKQTAAAPQSPETGQKQPWEQTQAQWLERINPQNQRIETKARPTVYAEDMEGMFEGGKVVKRTPIKDGRMLVIRETPDGEVFGQINGKTVGYATPLSKSELDITVDPTYQKQGIGARLQQEFYRRNPDFQSGGVTGAGEKSSRAAHRLFVEEALVEGKPVPPEVLRDYPDLATRQGGPTEPAALPLAAVKPAQRPSQEAAVKATASPARVPRLKPPPVEPTKLPKRGELSLPKTLEKAGLPGGEARFYDVKTNVESENKAKQIIKERGIEGATHWVQSGEQPSVEQSATALELIKGLAREAESAPADIKTAKLAQAGDLASTMAVRVKEQGQAIQYLHTLAKESPEGAVYYAEKRVKEKNPDARLTTEQRNGVFDVSVKLKNTEAELESTRTKLADVEKLLSESRRARREPQVTKRLKEWADQAEKDARARLAARTGVKGSEAGASTIPSDIADYAIIGAAKMARGTANFAEWSAAMVSEFGEDIRPRLRAIRSESERLVNEQSQLAKRGKVVDEITALSTDAQAVEGAKKFVRGMSRTDFQRDAMRSGLTRQQAHDLAVKSYKLYSEANRNLRQAGKERRAEKEEPDATPERRVELIAQRDALMRQRGKERRELQAMMRQIEEGRPSVYVRLNNQFRGIVVSALGTASRNVTTQVPRVVVEDLTKAFELAFVKGKSKLGWKLKEGDIDPRMKMLDAFNSSAYILQRNKRVTEGILDEFPVEYENLFRRFSSDVDVTPQTGISKGVHKKLDKVDKAIEIINIPNRFQEFLVRRAVFRGELETSLKAEGVDLNKTVAEGRQGEIDRAKIQKAVNTALRVTFADSPQRGSMGDAFVKFTSSAPAPINPLTFSRFLYNGAKFTLEYQPTTVARGLYRTLRGKPGASSDYAKAAVGTVMLITASQIYDSMHKDSSEWYLLNIPGVGEIDIRPYQPFASYIFASHWIRTKQAGKPISYEGTRTGNVGTYVEGLTGLSARPVPLYEVAKAAASESQEWDGVLRNIKRLGGETVAGLLTPLKSPKQIIAQFDQREAIVRDVSQEPFKGPIKRAIPFAGRGLPPLVRNEEVVTQPMPALQLAGIRTVMPDKRTEAEKLAQKLLRRNYDEARTDEEITRGKQTADLRTRARRGEAVDLSALSPRQRASIERSAGMTRPEETFKRLGLEDLLRVWPVAIEPERQIIKPMLADKADRVDNLDPFKDQLRAIGIAPIEELPPEKQRDILSKRRMENREQARQRAMKQRTRRQAGQRPSLGYGYQ